MAYETRHPYTGARLERFPREFSAAILDDCAEHAAALRACHLDAPF